MSNLKHLVIINTYNRVDELNKTIASINSYLPNAHICVISKGRESRKEVKGKIKYFYKVENIGREAHGYLWGFLKHPDYLIYTFLQDKPSEAYGSYYGKKIRIADNLIKKGKAEYFSGTTPQIDLLNGFPHHLSLKSLFCKNKKLNIKKILSYFKLKKIIVLYSPGACFSILGEQLDEKILKRILRKESRKEFFAWEMERVWSNIATRCFWIDEQNTIKEYSYFKAMIEVIKQFFKKCKNTLPA